VPNIWRDTRKEKKYIKWHGNQVSHVWSLIFAKSMLRMVKTAKRNVWSPKYPNSPLACRNACTARQKRGEQICRKRFSKKNQLQTEGRNSARQTYSKLRTQSKQLPKISLASCGTLGSHPNMPLIDKGLQNKLALIRF
jgi:hypothetical protein